MTETFQPRDPRRFEAALRRFDEENSRDPHVDQVAGVAHPRELLYAQWLTEWVLKLCPEASEELRLAARCQHLCRWMVPRDSYPMTRAGYLKWREVLKHFHAEKAGEILREVGYPEEVIARVQSLNLKKNFPQDAEGRVLEDALCLVFLEHQFGDLASKTHRGQDDQRPAEGVEEDDPRVASASAQAFLQPTAAGLARQGAQALQFEAVADRCKFGAGLTDRRLSFSRRRARNFPYARFSKTPIAPGSLSR